MQITHRVVGHPIPDLLFLSALDKHIIQGAVKLLNQSISLEVIGSCVDFLDYHNSAHFSYQVGQEHSPSD